jgi:ketosteroid isomerase-like protein
VSGVGTTEAPEATRRNVLEANEAFYRAFNAGDIDAMDALWARDLPVACVHPNWLTLHGREEVMESWRGILGNPDQPRVVAGGSTVHVIGDVAYVLTQELVSGQPLAATNLFAVEDGEWRLIHHHSSPVAFSA